MKKIDLTRYTITGDFSADIVGVPHSSANPKWWEWIIRPKTALRQRRFFTSVRGGKYSIPYVPLTFTKEPYNDCI